VRASATPAVPYGYICGFPLPSAGSSEHWGFVAGQSLGHAQAQAVAAAAQRWAGAGCSELSFGVCKAGYRPFDAEGRRLFGCLRHSGVRAERMARVGPRPGWASFEQPEWAPPAPGRAGSGTDDDVIPGQDPSA
jgi:hypothetical protein